MVKTYKNKVTMWNPLNGVWIETTVDFVHKWKELGFIENNKIMMIKPMKFINN